MSTPSLANPASAPAQMQSQFGTAAFDSREFRRALGSFPTGVAIITTRDGEREPSGLTCNSFSSVSLEPPLVSWSLRKASKSIDIFRNAGAFAINVLAEDQDHLSQRFATSSIANKFEGVAWSTGFADLPLIDHCVARFHCSVFAQHDAGDHVVFIGKVERFEVVREEDPLVFYKGAYMMLSQSLRDIAVKGRISPAALGQARKLIYAALLKLACQNGEAADFAEIEANLHELERHVAACDMPARTGSAIRFFDLISRTAHNDVMAIVAQSLNTLLEHTVRAHTAASVYVAELDPVRWQILASLKARDAEAAVAAMDRYIDRATDH